jgi:hypothetical protein
MKPFVLLIACLLSTFHALRAQSHDHITAGIFDSDHDGVAEAGEPLAFVNGANYNSASGFVLSLTAKISGRYAGTFSGNITFTALGIDPLVGGPEPGHAAPGTHIVIQLVKVTGPGGATFSFWDATGSLPAVSLGVDEAGTDALRWDLSENDGAPGDDPFGHIHGRQFSVDQAGTYVATFRLFDTSTNGPGGGPIHPASELFQMKFVAVPEPATIALLALAGFSAVFRTRRRG